MWKEDLQDAGEILHTILSQPLAIQGLEKETSLIEAARAYPNQEPETSDLRKVLLSFLQYPEPTDTLVRELHWLEEDLPG